MLRRNILFSLLLVLCFLPCLNALAEDGNEPYSFNGASWGMTKNEVKALVDEEPFQEFRAVNGQSVLAYQTELDGFACVIQYNFLRSGELFNIEIMAPDAEKAFYAMLADAYTSQYGDALTEEDASMDADEPAPVMMAYLMQTTADIDFLAWQADEVTVITLSFEPSYKVCYAEIRRFTDYFRFVPDAEE